MGRAVSSIVLGMLIATASGAECPESPRAAERFGAFQFLWENDSLLPTDETDRDYTNGLRLSYTRNPCFGSAPRWTESLAERWCRLGLCGGATSIDVGYAFGQSIYTPYRYVSSSPQPFDRPYAGHLYGAWLIQATHSVQVDDFGAGEEERTQTTFELQVGWLGPHAYAEEVQNGWHRLFNEEEAKGWDFQLDDEPTLNFHLNWRRKLGGKHFDLIPHAGVALGTVITQANLGATLRIGTHLARLPQLGLPQIRRQQFEAKRLEASAFVTVDGRYSAHNVFVDGGVFRNRDDLRIESENFVYDLRSGFAVRWKNWTLNYSWTRRSPEFESRTLPGGREQIFRSYGITRHLTLP